MVFATTQQNDKAAWLPGELDLASITLDLAPFKQEIEAALTAVGAREMEEIGQSHVRLPTLAPLLAGVADGIEPVVSRASWGIIDGIQVHKRSGGSKSEQVKQRMNLQHCMHWLHLEPTYLASYPSRAAHARPRMASPACHTG